MLSYIDAPQFIKVLRHDAETGRRTRLAMIVKGSFEVRSDPKTVPSDAENAEIQHVIAHYKSAEDAQKRADMLRFPEIVRSASDYYVTCDQPVERKLIVDALLEGLRTIRKADRDSASDPKWRTARGLD